ncbi:type IV pilin N-terminal domain-containing protein [Methanococcoides methylutens]|uniref:Archaeal Type IV pilin N-terminal domain-containing protein n=1 Tax=Methanococcoides methylutens MM1 TaxID=1434104 RepID=A0A0E3ST26_METMT|nr:type IV pilin N-terminal domain-containing protein [Methanococcoides methylutens]AKB85868.1 hypothetical protein MCMEM_1815 [Methanococcoides methylutens MM1]
MVSEIVGEMLKLSIMVSLVTVFSIGVFEMLPDERVPYVEIEIVNVSGSSLDISHVGGDVLKAEEITIQVANASGPFIYELSDKDHVCRCNSSTGALDSNQSVIIWKFPERIHVNTDVMNITDVSVVHRRAVLATSEVSSNA